MKRAISNNELVYLKKRKYATNSSGHSFKHRNSFKKNIKDILDNFQEKLDKETKLNDDEDAAAAELSSSDESIDNASESRNLDEENESDEYNSYELEVDFYKNQNKLNQLNNECGSSESEIFLPKPKKKSSKLFNHQLLIDLDELKNLEVIQVNCNSIIGELHKKKFGSGGKGNCIRVDSKEFPNDPNNTEDLNVQIEEKNKTRSAEKWMTPIEFENYCGKGNCKDWKRTLKVGGLPLVTLLENQILIVHAVCCSCSTCNLNEELVGPIKPFRSYTRRNKDEILAQNAFKKFLSLKPPTLLKDKLISKFQSQSDLIRRNLIEAEMSIVGESVISDCNQNDAKDQNVNKLSESFPSASTSNNRISKKNSFDQSPDSSVEDVLELEDKQWTLLEQVSVHFDLAYAW